jgi:hypothetical protein
MTQDEILAEPIGSWAGMVGLVDEEFRGIPGLLSADGNVIPFADFVQYIGPPRAWYEEPGGGRYYYQAFGWQSDGS